MMSKEQLEGFRRMTPGQRLSLSTSAMKANWPYMFHGTPELVQRRFELVRRENDARNRAILERLAAAEVRRERVG